MRYAGVTIIRGFYGSRRANWEKTRDAMASQKLDVIKSYGGEQRLFVENKTENSEAFQGIFSIQFLPSSLNWNT